MSSPEAIEWLFSLQRFGMEPGLERTRALLDAVGSPQRNLKVVLVGGTNGKGSVTAVLAACLRAAGHRTGSFFSPHLQRVGERAMVDGVEATHDEMAEALATVRPHALRLDATFFEVVTVASLLRFEAAAVRWAVMEVGLGGRLDATNALEPSLSLITAVGLDHLAVLGPDLASVAAEKAGILRPGVPALTAATGVALDVIAEKARELGTPLAVLGRDFSALLASQSWDGIEVVVESGVQALDSLSQGGPTADRPAVWPLPLKLRSPLLGAHQADNVALAVIAALRLGVDTAQLSEAVSTTRWPGRLEVIEHRQRRFVLDGAHNPHAAAALAQALVQLGAEVAALILGMSDDKDVEGVVAALRSLTDTAIATRAALSPRSLEPADLVKRLHGFGHVLSSSGPHDALQVALEVTKPGATVVVAGSLFLVGEFRTLLAGAHDEPGQRWQ